MLEEELIKLMYNNRDMVLSTFKEVITHFRNKEINSNVITI